MFLNALCDIFLRIYNNSNIVALSTSGKRAKITMNVEKLRKDQKEKSQKKQNVCVLTIFLEN